MSTSTAAPQTAATKVRFAQKQVIFRVALRWQRRSFIVCLVLALLTLGVSLCSLAIGDYNLSLRQTVLTLLGRPEDPFHSVVVLQWRLPRAIAAVIFGAALAASGAIFQSLTRNPLASPDIIGFSAGSYTGALIVIILVGGSYLQVAVGALLGGIITAILVYLVAWRHGVQGFRLIIVGIAFSAMLGSYNTWLMLQADLDVAMSAAAWGAGSLNSITTEQAAVGGAVILVLLCCMLPIGRKLLQLELGDDAAKASGVRVESVRLSAMVIGVALTAAVTAAAGPIAFIALAAPQISRRLARSPGITLGPALFTGAFLLALADLCAQHLLPVALPVGVVTVVIGGGYLTWLIVHEVRRRT